MAHDNDEDDDTGDAPDKPAPPPPPFVPPVGTQALLDGQLAEALRILHDFADWIHLPSADIERCISVSHAVGSLMTDSGRLAKVALGIAEPAEGKQSRRNRENE